MPEGTQTAPDFKHRPINSSVEVTRGARSAAKEARERRAAPSLDVEGTSNALVPLRFGRFVIRLRAVTPWTLPPFKGGTLRGAIGRGLKIGCTGVEKPCGCRKDVPCLYRSLFNDGSVPEPPRPFVIEPPLTERSRYRTGETVDFGLTLVGRAIENLPAFIWALDHVGRERGLGGTERGGRFELVEAWQRCFRCPPLRIYDGRSQSWLGPPIEETLADMTYPAALAPGEGDLTINFITPTHLRYKLRDQAKQDDLRHPTFEGLVRRLLSRLQLLMELHCDAKLDINYGAFFLAARNVEMTAEATRWVRFDRYSSSQEDWIPVEGLMGSARYRGHFAPFAPLLMLGEALHVGKGTAFGLGQYRVIAE